MKAEESLDGGGSDLLDQLCLNLLGAVPFSQLLPTTSPSQSSASSARYDYIL